MNPYICKSCRNGEHACTSEDCTCCRHLYDHISGNDRKEEIEEDISGFFIEELDTASGEQK